MTRAGHKHLGSRTKGILTNSYTHNRLACCKQKVKTHVGQDFWSYDVSLYIDGTGFVLKTDPMDRTLAAQTREWRKPNEGLRYRVLPKTGKKTATEAKFIVGKSHNLRVVLCE